MKISAVIVSRNDNYGGYLNERATYCLNSAIETFDEVIYVDWNSESHSLLYDIKDNLITEIAKILTNNDPDAQVCCEVLGRNIGLRRATGDWLVSTNIDVIAPKRDELEKTINNLQKAFKEGVISDYTDPIPREYFDNELFFGPKPAGIWPGSGSMFKGRDWYRDAYQKWYDKASPEVQEYIRNKVVKAPGTSGPKMANMKLASNLARFLEK